MKCSFSLNKKPLKSLSHLHLSTHQHKFLWIWMKKRKLLYIISLNPLYPIQKRVESSKSFSFQKYTEFRKKQFAKYVILHLYLIVIMITCFWYCKADLFYQYLLQDSYRQISWSFHFVWFLQYLYRKKYNKNNNNKIILIHRPDHP